MMRQAVPGLRSITFYTYDESFNGADVFTQKVDKKVFDKLSTDKQFASNPKALESSLEFLDLLDGRCDIQLKCEKKECPTCPTKDCPKCGTVPTCGTTPFIRTTPRTTTYPRTTTSRITTRTPRTFPTPTVTTSRKTTPTVTTTRKTTPTTFTTPTVTTSRKTTPTVTTTRKTTPRTFTTPTVTTSRKTTPRTRTFNPPTTKTTKITTPGPPYLPLETKPPTTRIPWTGPTRSHPRPSFVYGFTLGYVNNTNTATYPTVIRPSTTRVPKYKKVALDGTEHLVPN
ncbi:CLUMA_CG006911, isoform A [Clunio marinus]|uniref:CLUMA_CG006911, isoform A n=1 Tax=Clunio marinus TaxID=568069 RepID=A0A1J1HZ45_9DIPT|nr:CLUMA_CG006911, isoform A [Clunio marinus]